MEITKPKFRLAGKHYDKDYKVKLEAYYKVLALPIIPVL